jgi:8-oxo-dGTP pyrophosphatase MutT (NUDIX family)
VHSASMRLTTGRSQARAHEPSAKSDSASQRGARECEQVAAVCYRVRSGSIEFLLVRTRRGRWTFPKGGIEPRLTRAQSASIEAFEEAGVHGRIEQVAFARYRRGKRGNMREPVVVHAYLCEVFRLDAPQEPDRSRTWFCPEKAKLHLREARANDNGEEVARVVDRAVARIQRLRGRSTAAADALQKVQFEASEVTGSRTAMDKAFIQYVRRRRVEKRGSAEIEFAVQAYLSEAVRREALRLSPAQFNEATAPLIAGKLKRHSEKNRTRDYVGDAFAGVVQGNGATASALQNPKVVQINKARKIRGS